MSTVRNILVALLCISPLCLFWDGLIVQGLASGIAALALALTARSLRPGETEFLVSVARPAMIAAAIPAFWVILQIIPFGIVAHPIWKSASAALHEPIPGSISLDRTASIISLGAYLLLAAITFLSAAVAVDRQRAEWVLFALCIATCIASIIVIGHQFVPYWPMPSAFTQATECISLGIIIAATILVRAIERYGIKQHRAHGEPQSRLPGLKIFIPGLAALVICGSAFSLLASRQATFAAAFGLLTLASQSTVRRFELGWWGAMAVTIPAVMIAILLIASYPTHQPTSPTVAFVDASNPSSIALSQRMVDDAPVVGIGAGAFKDLAPVYRENNDPPPGSTAATAAANLSIELGKPMLWLIVAATASIILVLLRASLQRGRDSFYAAMAASGLLTISLLAFVNAGLFGTATGIIFSAMLGLGLAQSKSRKVHI
jgi:hypothetical protein